jgi:hypothetical protein
LIVSFELVINLLRAVTVWAALRRLLRRIAWHPLHESCAELGALRMRASAADKEAKSEAGKSESLVPPISLTAQMPTFTGLAFSVQEAARLIRCTNEISALNETQPYGVVATVNSQLNYFQELARSNLTQALEADADGDLQQSQRCKLNAQRALANLTAWTSYILEADWLAPNEIATAEESAENKRRRTARLFMASRVLDYSRHILAQLRNLIGFSIAGFLLLLMSASSYPFPHSDSLLRATWLMLLGAIVLSAWIFVQMNKDETLSLLRGGTPGQIDWNSAFVGHLAFYVLLPLLTVFGIRFPATLDGIVRGIASIIPGASH